MTDRKCPVCDWTVETPFQVEVGHGIVVVCCKECAEQVRQDPERFGTSSSAIK